MVFRLTEFKDYEEDFAMKYDRYAAVSGTTGNCKLKKEEREAIVDALIEEAKKPNACYGISFRAVAAALGYKHVKTDDVRATAVRFLNAMPDWKAVVFKTQKTATSLFIGLEFVDWDDEAILELAEHDTEADMFGKLKEEKM